MRTKFHIFQVVANHLSFTKAAEQLYISQPAISKAIKNLEEEFKTTLFIRRRNSIELTKEGKSFLVYTQKVVALFSEMEETFTKKNDVFPERINLGASTTISNYIIPKIIAKFNNQFPTTRFNTIGGNTEMIQNMILNEELDFGITEGSNSNPKLTFKKFIKDEIVLVTNSSNNQFKKGSISLDNLQSLQLISREIGSGTREIIDSFLVKHGYKKVNRMLTFTSTESIKNYLYHSDYYALISIHAISDDLKSNRLQIIDLKNASIERWFYFVRRTGHVSSTLDYLEKYIRLNYNL